MNELPIGEKVNISSFISIHSYEEICAMVILTKICPEKYIIFVTKMGMIKKSLLSEYNITRAGGARAIDLTENDQIASIIFINEEPIGILSAEGNLVLVQTEDIRATGRITKGIKGIKLNDGDYVVAAKTYRPQYIEIASISEDGYAKRSPLSDFVITNKNTKGKKLQKINENDKMIDFLFIKDQRELVFTSTSAQIKISIDEIAQLSRGAQGNKVMKLKDNDKVVSLRYV